MNASGCWQRYFPRASRSKQDFGGCGQPTITRPRRRENERKHFLDYALHRCFNPSTLAKGSRGTSFVWIPTLRTVLNCMYEILAAGLLAVVASLLISAPAYSQDAREVPSFNAPAMPKEAIDYESWGLPTPQAPTADRPYHYVRFDQSVKGEYEGTPLMMNSARPDLLVVLNFIDEQNEYSQRQTELLEGALTYLAPRSTAKELMLVDIVVRDEQGNKPYGNEYTNVYEANSLGPDGAPIAEYTLPYGVVRGEELVAGKGNTLYDFSIYANAINERDLLENSRTIAVVLQGFVTAYNRKKKQ